jgi:hypothetical protein
MLFTYHQACRKIVRKTAIVIAIIYNYTILSASARQAYPRITRTDTVTRQRELRFV